MSGITTSRLAETMDIFIQLLKEKKQSLINGKPFPISENDFATMNELVHSLLSTQEAEAGIGCSSQISTAAFRMELSSSLNENKVESDPLELEDEVEPGALELDRPRCLLVSDGYVMCCLDLNKQKSKYKSMEDVPSLPKTGILKLLLEERYPVSVGLFKLGCDAYIIGGQDLSLSGYPDPSAVRAQYYDYACRCLDPWGIGVYAFVAVKHGMKASSREAYRLSKEADGTLSLSTSEECNIPAMKKPKVWPIVEKIEGLIHVIQTLPPRLTDLVMFEEKFTHEFIDPNDLGKGWTEIPTDDLYGPAKFGRHLVVGDRIYAITGRSLLTFDSKAKKWETCALDFPSADHLIFVEQVWHVLLLGNGRYVGKYLHHGEPSEPLYMVIAIVRNCYYDVDEVDAVAYLASSTGQVLCFQRLLHFFEGRVRPRQVTACTVFNVDEQEEQGSMMMCSVVNGKIGAEFGLLDYLLINTFVVEALADAGTKVRELLGDESCTKYPVELEFVRVVVKDRYVYKTDTELKEKADLSTFPRVDACFL